MLVYSLWNSTLTRNLLVYEKNHRFTTPTHANQSHEHTVTHVLHSISFPLHCVMGFWSYPTILYQLTILPISDGKTNVSCLLTVARVIFHVMTKSLVAHAAIWAWGIKAVGVFWAHEGSLLAFVYICKWTTCPYGKTIQNVPHDAWIVSNTCHRESSEVKIWNLVDFSSAGLSHNWQK